ncbi:TetR family transcriptional regulator [Nocardia sp. NPDC004260]
MTAGQGVGLRARHRRRTENTVIDIALTMFLDRGFDAVTVEEICAAAEISPRTFYRYFPAKEDILVADPDVDDVLRDCLGRGHRPGESDVDFIARSIVTAMSARRPDRLERSYRLFRTTPACQARLERFVWQDQQSMADALLDGKTRTATSELRARIIVHTVSQTIRLAVADWIRHDRTEDLHQACASALRLLREALTQ